MKLELKHFSAYLPYGLKIARVSIDGDFKGIEYSLRETNLVEVLRYDNLKPILRPLSEISKEIVINGKRITPILELAKLFHISKSSITSFGRIKDEGFYGIGVDCYMNGSDREYSHFQMYGDEFILDNSYSIIQKLLEWHFDVFNLHENGLCIYYNEL